VKKKKKKKKKKTFESKGKKSRHLKVRVKNLKNKKKLMGIGQKKIQNWAKKFYWT
jgi:hypothetical protein